MEDKVSWFLGIKKSWGEMDSLQHFLRVLKVQEKVLKIDRPLAGGFLSLTALRAEGCGGRFVAVFEKGARLTAQVGPASRRRVV